MSRCGRACRINKPPKSPLTSARESAEVGRVINGLSTAHLTGLQAPAMRGVHASLDHVATAVVIIRIVVAVPIRVIVSVVVIRVEAKAEAAPEVAISIMKSTAAETTIAIVESTTIVESATITECAGHAATTEAATIVESAGHATTEAATAAVATAAAASSATASTSQRHCWRSHANRRDCQ